MSVAIFGALILLKCITVGTLCGQLLQFYIDQFETVQTLLSWSVDVHVVFALLCPFIMGVRGRGDFVFSADLSA